MKQTLKFLIETQRLKEIPRTGWVLMRLEKPETIADHIFRVAFENWLLGRKKNLNVARLIQISLAHDLCEVYAGDKTPFFYWDGLKREIKEEEKILLRGVRLSQKEKIERSKKKFENEKNSLLKLLSFLNSKKKNEIFSRWLDFEKRISKEGNFAKQVDRIETLLQAIEYFGPDEIKGGTSWWELTEEIVDDPFLLEFLKTIQKKFYKRVPDYQKNKYLENSLDFLLKIGKLKRLPRLYWRLRGVKNPETVAGHIFTLSLMAWIFGIEKSNLNIRKLLKMALCHEITAVETGDTTPYDRILRSRSNEKEKILARMLRLSAKEKRKNFWDDYKIEKRALKKITKKLDREIKKEIFDLWEDYRKKKSSEAYFLSQLNTVAVLFQGIWYKKRDENFSTFSLWEWALESIEDPIILRFLEELKEYEKN